MIHFSHQTDLPLHAQGMDLRLQTGLFRAVTNDEQFGAGAIGMGCGKVLNQHINALFAAKTPHKQKGRVALLQAKVSTGGFNILCRHIFRQKNRKIHNVGNHIDMSVHAAAPQKGNHLHRRADHLGGIFGQVAEIAVCHRFCNQILHIFVRGHIKQIIVIRGVQGVHHRLFHAAGTEQPKNAHGEFRLDMDDIGVEILHDAVALQIQGIGHTIAVQPLERHGRAIQNAALHIVALCVRVHRYDQHLITAGLQAFFYGFNMCYNAADKGVIGLRKNCYFHARSPCF